MPSLADQWVVMHRKVEDSHDDDVVVEVVHTGVGMDVLGCMGILEQWRTAAISARLDPQAVLLVLSTCRTASSGITVLLRIEIQSTSAPKLRPVCPVHRSDDDFTVRCS